ncbi:hypothetical protein HDU76_006313, partial [Blyttiomyces sp. JEL0837]
MPAATSSNILLLLGSIVSTRGVAAASASVTAASSLTSVTTWSISSILQSTVVYGVITISGLCIVNYAFSVLIPTPPVWLAGSLPPPHSTTSSTTTKQQSSSRPHRIYIGQTYHQRITPVTHIFRYPVIYVGLNLDHLDNENNISKRQGSSSFYNVFSWLWGYNRRAVFSVWDKDYLGPVIKKKDGDGDKDKQEFVIEGVEGMNIKERLLAHLEALNVPRSEVGEVELVTSPRFFGVAFNPLNTYYIFAKGSNSGSLRAVLLEVNNTFGERHLYICDKRNEIVNRHVKAGYEASFNVKRAFHVSPFNNRTGHYEAHVSNPATKNSMDVLLVMKDYKPNLPSPSSDSASTATTTSSSPTIEKHFKAREYGTAFPVSNGRILVEARKLAYSRGLPVYQRPNPYRVVSRENGGTILRKRMDKFQVFCQSTAINHLEHQAKQHNTQLQIILPDKTVKLVGLLEPSPSSSSSSTPTITLHINSPNFFVRLVTDADDTGRALSTTFTRGDWTCDNIQEITKFLILMTGTSASESTPPMTPQRNLVRYIRRWYHNDTLKTDYNIHNSPFRSAKFVRVDDSVGGDFTTGSGWGSTMDVVKAGRVVRYFEEVKEDGDGAVEKDGLVEKNEDEGGVDAIEEEEVEKEYVVIGRGGDDGVDGKVKVEKKEGVKLKKADLGAVSNGDGQLVGEMDDQFAIEEREKVRFLAFLKAFRSAGIRSV